MVNEGDSMNFSSFEGDGINQKEIIDLAETLPFFADKRVILIICAGQCLRRADAPQDGAGVRCVRAGGKG